MDFLRAARWRKVHMYTYCDIDSFIRLKPIYPMVVFPLSDNGLVQEHVSPEGWVDYKGFIRDSTRLQRYLKLLSNHHPNEKYWSREERLAYWINAYNAFTVKLVADHYPLSGIKDIRNGFRLRTSGLFLVHPKALPLFPFQAGQP